MPTDLKRAIEHFFIIMENRSFDHMLGYLNLPPWNHDRKKVEPDHHLRCLPIPGTLQDSSGRPTGRAT